MRSRSQAKVKRRPQRHPLSIEFLEKVLESNEQFALRKLEWLVTDYTSRGQLPTVGHFEELVALYIETRRKLAEQIHSAHRQIAAKVRKPNGVATTSDFSSERQTTPVSACHGCEP